MNETMEALVKRLDPDSVHERKIVVRQAVQEVALNGLSETDFFDRAAFCGGTALRIFHGLDRFSEDLDFSLQSTDWEFSFDEYLPAICGKAQSFGFELEAKSKVKSEGNNIKSAMIKGNTRELLGLCYPDDGSASHVAKDDSARIKIEADVNPPALASYEVLRSSPPLDYTARLHDMPSLFAGKIDAVLCRPWKNLTKGRDLSISGSTSRRAYRSTWSAWSPESCLKATLILGIALTETVCWICFAGGSWSSTIPPRWRMPGLSLPIGPLVRAGARRCSSPCPRGWRSADVGPDPVHPRERTPVEPVVPGERTPGRAGKA